MTPRDQETEEQVAFRESINHGIDPLYVGELVLEGIEKNWDYIFTDLEYEPLIQARFAAIQSALDRIRDRKPRY